MMKKTFSKSERLSTKTLIKELFDKGSSFYFQPFKVLYLPSEASKEHQLLISVPKKNHKLAVKRNRLKRRIREAYRLHKPKLQSTKKYLIAYIYISKEILEYAEIEKSILMINNRIKKSIDEKV